MASRGKIPNNATTMSLHERFSNLRKSPGAQPSRAQNRRQNTSAAQLASSKNKRLAKQMERRATVNNTALKLKKKSIKQRLGGGQPTFNTGSRFRGSLTQMQRGAATKRGNTRGGKSPRVKTVNNPMVNNVRGRGQTVRGKGRGRNTVLNRSGTAVSPTKGRQQTNRGRGGATVSPNNVGRGRNQRGRGQARNQNTNPHNQGKSPNQSSRGRGQGSRGRGANSRGRGREQSVKVSKEDLDKQLDQYMSKTKSVLDQQLEGYMSKLA